MNEDNKEFLDISIPDEVLEKLSVFCEEYQVPKKHVVVNGILAYMNVYTTAIKGKK